MKNILFIFIIMTISGCDGELREISPTYDCSKVRYSKAKEMIKVCLSIESNPENFIKCKIEVKDLLCDKSMSIFFNDSKGFLMDSN